MNTTKHDTRNLAAELADDAGMVAYRAARRSGADPQTAMGAYLSAYTEALRG